VQVRSGRVHSGRRSVCLEVVCNHDRKLHGLASSIVGAEAQFVNAGRLWLHLHDVVGAGPIDGFALDKPHIAMGGVIYEGLAGFIHLLGRNVASHFAAKLVRFTPEFERDFAAAVAADMDKERLGSRESCFWFGPDGASCVVHVDRPEPLLCGAATQHRPEHQHRQFHGSDVSVDGR
jgi:hypothetical protein